MYVAMAASGGELDMEDELHTSHDGSGKKAGNKFLQPFRKMRRFFSSRRRGKGRDGEEETSRVSIKSKSTTDVLRAGQEEALEEESTQLVSNKTLSMSADSVFTPDTRPKESQLEGLKASARSMEQLAQPAFTSELFQKLKSRRSEEEEDDGLPRSPVTQPSTRDVLDEFKKPKRHHDSKHSVDSSMSSEDELDEKDVFATDWTAVTASKSNNAITDSTEELNFELLSSTSSLPNTGARHKLEVSQRRNVRPSTQFRRPQKAQTATSLPQVEEKEEIKAEQKEEKEATPSPAVTPEVDAKVEHPKETPKIEVVEAPPEEEKLETPVQVEEEEKNERNSEIEVKADVEPVPEKRKLSDSGTDAQEAQKPTSSEKPVEKPLEKVEDKVSEKPVEEKPKERPVVIVIPKVEKKASPVTTPRSPKPQEKKEVEPERKEPEEKIAEPVKNEEKTQDVKDLKSSADTDDSSPFKVVLRKTGRRANLDEAGTIRRRDNVGDKDPTKRQTIAGDSGLMLFGDRKAGQRTSFVEVSHSPDTKDSDTGNNEFTQVLSRLKKQPSRKKLIPDEKAGKSATGEKKAAVAEPKAKVSEVSSPKPVESSPKVVVVEAKPSSVENISKKVEVKPNIADTKPKVDFSSKPKLAENKPKIAESKPRIADSKPKVIIETKSSTSKAEDIKKPEKQEVKPKETIVISKESQVSQKPAELKEKEVIVVSKNVDTGKPKEPEVKVSKSELVSPLKPISVSESKAQASSVSEQKVVKKPEPAVGKTIIIEKPKPVEAKLPPADKVEPKQPPKVEVKAEDKLPKKDSATSTKNRVRSQTLTEQPVTEGANKENEKTPKSVQRSNSHGDAVDDKAFSQSSPSAPTTAPAPAAVTAAGKTGEPAWFTLARRKTANWGQKEKDLEEIKEKKETSNQAEKERGDANATTKGKEVTLTIDDAAKEESKPALRNVGKCSNSASSRQSKVLDMAKLFQNQVS